MKKLLTICLLLAIAMASAQEKKMSFEETSLYLKENLIEKARYSEDIVYVNSNEQSTVPLFEFIISPKGLTTFTSVTVYRSINVNFAKVLKIESKDDEIHFFVTNNSYYLITVETQIDAERITNAFIHLKSLIPDEKDPFDK